MEQAREDLPFEEVRHNKEKDYSAIHNPRKLDEMQGRLQFLKHELMISRFHAMLEMACNRSSGKVELVRLAARIRNLEKG